MTENDFILFDRIEVIKKTIEKYGEENFYISFSGGKDSTVLHHLIDEAIPGNKIPRVFMNTGIEYNYRTLKFDSELGKAYVYSCVLGSVEDDDVLAYVIALGLHLGYSIEEIYNEYIRKNEINKERLVKGY